MLVVGLTGGIASGKSTVSRMLEDAGIPVICADELAHRAVDPGSPALDEIRAAFGDSVIDEYGRLDREAMADLVFRNPANRKLLESIIHPRVAEQTESRIESLKTQGYEVVVIDVPLLYEVGWESMVDLVIVAYIPRELQERRLIQRDQVSLDKACARLNAQMDIEKKKMKADMVVDNSGAIDETKHQVAELLKNLKSCRKKCGNRQTER